jgi:hypothetical protein
MVDIKHKQCVQAGCKAHVRYGYIGQGQAYCAKHKLQGMFTKPNTICQDDCKELAIYGIAEPLHCEEHHTDKEICLLVKKCEGCGKENMILNKNNRCLIYCEPDDTYKQVKREKKFEKLTLSYLDKYLQTKVIPIPIDDSITDSMCNKRRPDRVYDCGTHFVIIEVDENQHKSYDVKDETGCKSELVRMYQIYEGLGYMDVVFLRFNPNNFRVAGKLQKVNMQKRLETLLKWTEYCIGKVPNANDNEEIKESGVKYKHLFYNEYDETDTEFKILKFLTKF